MTKQYLEHSRAVLSDKRAGYKRSRTGIDIISLFGYQNEYSLDEGFPLLTTKKMGIKQIAHELMWFIHGDSNIKYLVDNTVHIWDDNAFQHFLEKTGGAGKLEVYSEAWLDAQREFIQKIKEDGDFAAKNGDLGPVYGKQWRRWRTHDGKEIDQFERLIETLRKDKNSRRLIVSAWNPEEVPSMALPPCHVLYQLNVQGDNLDLLLYQRSCDMFLGVPFNIASYSMLAQIIAQQAGLKPGRFVHTFGDSHFYCGSGERGNFYKENFDKLKKRVADAENGDDYELTLRWIENSASPEEKGKSGQDHVTGILEQLQRESRLLPKLTIANKHYSQLTIDDFILEGYNPHPPIRRAMAV